MTELKGSSELRFFGTVTASVSHDLKNVLAIVNENAGLIEDMLAFAAQGRAIDPARLILAAQAIKTQIRRGDAIINNLNRFAHSADGATAVIAVDQALELALSLTARMAAMRGVAVTMTSPAGSVVVRTAPFVFQQLMWRCLDNATDFEGSQGGAIEITVETVARGACIRLKGPAGRCPDPMNGPIDQALLDSVGAKAAVDQATGEMIITLNPEPR